MRYSGCSVRITRQAYDQRMGILGRSHTPEEKAARKAERLRKRVERIRETEARERAARTAAKKSASGVQQLAAFGPIEIRRLTPTMPVKLRHHEIGESRSLSGAKALIEAGEALEARITATRTVLTGVFALAWRKKKGGESWLTIEGPGFFWVEKVERGQMEAARAFAACVNNEARRAS